MARPIIGVRSESSRSSTSPRGRLVPGSSCPPRGCARDTRSGLRAGDIPRAEASRRLPGPVFEARDLFRSLGDAHVLAPTADVRGISGTVCKPARLAVIVPGPPGREINLDLDSAAKTATAHPTSFTRALLLVIEATIPFQLAHLLQDGTLTIARDEIPPFGFPVHALATKVSITRLATGSKLLSGSKKPTRSAMACCPFSR